MNSVDTWLAKMIELQASDLHIAVGRPLTMRIHGELQEISGQAADREDVSGFLSHILDDQARKSFDLNHDVDCAFQSETGRFRVNCFYNLHGPALVLRTIASHPPSLADIHAPDILSRLVGLRNGLVIVTGPTGSGKSSTLAAMVDHINRNENKHIVTLEDPIEFVHRSARSLITQREIGTHTKNFTSGLRAALREDPDVILVGEMRDHETISLALTAAETGHLVFATLHTNSAHRAVLRLIDSMPIGQRDVARAMLANSLQAVIAQTLVKASSGGRVAAFETLIGTHAVRNLIAEDQTPQLYSLMQMGARYHMQTMEMALESLVRDGKVDPATAKATIKRLQGSSIAEDESVPDSGHADRQTGSPAVARSQALGEITF